MFRSGESEVGEKARQEEKLTFTRAKVMKLDYMGRGIGY